MNRHVIQRAVTAAALSVLVTSVAHADFVGFGGFSPVNATIETAGGVQMPGSAPGVGIFGNTFTLTRDGPANGVSGFNGQATSAFQTTAQSLNGFTVTYDYTVSEDFTPPSGGIADGYGFVVHNDPRGVSALGNRGGDRGFANTGAANPNPANIKSGAAALFNLFGTNNATIVTTDAAGIGTFRSGFNTGLLTGGQTVRTTVSYYNGRVSQSFVNTTTGATGFNTQLVDFTAAAGGTTALVGFTAGTGGSSTTQRISNPIFRTDLAYAPVVFTGFTDDLVVDALAPAISGTNLQSFVTATIDAGRPETANTFFERGLVGSNPLNDGLPMGTTIVSAADASHSFALAASDVNNAFLLSPTTTTAGGPPSTATATLAAPAAFDGFSLALATGNGSDSFSVLVSFTDGSTELITGVLGADWFNNAATDALGGLGRVNVENSGLGQTNADANPRLHQVDFVLANTSSLVQSLTFTKTTGTGHTAIFAISGSVVPEPTTLAALGIGASLLRRRRAR